MFYCQECGRKFKTVKAAEKATSVGCPKCGGVDIDIGTYQEREEKARQELEIASLSREVGSTFPKDG